MPFPSGSVSPQSRGAHPQGDYQTLSTGKGNGKMSEHWPDTHQMPDSLPRALHLRSWADKNAADLSVLRVEPLREKAF